MVQLAKRRASHDVLFDILADFALQQCLRHVGYDALIAD
jgi:hypothetical protein